MSTLFDPGPPAEARLTERQRRVLEAVRTSPGGITAAQAGSYAGASEAWAESTGRDILTRLRTLGYGLVRRRTGQWEIPGTTPLPPDPEGVGPGDFPPGY